MRKNCWWLGVLYLLIGFQPAWASAHFDFSRLAGSDEDRPAKEHEFRLVSIPKNIAISNTPNQRQIFVCVLNHAHCVSGCLFCITWRSDRDTFSRAEGDPCQARQSIRYFYFRPSFGFANERCCSYLEKSRWRLSGVGDLKKTSKSSSIPHVICPRRMDVGLQPILIGFLGVGKRSVGRPPQADSRHGQNASESNKPKREIRYWVASGLLPKPVMLTFLCGALIGWLIVMAIVKR